MNKTSCILPRVRPTGWLFPTPIPTSANPPTHHQVEWQNSRQVCGFRPWVVFEGVSPCVVFSFPFGCVQFYLRCVRVFPLVAFGFTCVVFEFSLWLRSVLPWVVFVLYFESHSGLDLLYRRTSHFLKQATTMLLVPTLKNIVIYRVFRMCSEGNSPRPGDTPVGTTRSCSFPSQTPPRRCPQRFLVLQHKHKHLFSHSFFVSLAMPWRHLRCLLRLIIFGIDIVLIQRSLFTIFSATGAKDFAVTHVFDSR